MIVWLALAEGYEATCIIAACSSEAEARLRAIAGTPQHKPYADTPAVARLNLDDSLDHSPYKRKCEWRFKDGQWRAYP